MSNGQNGDQEIITAQRKGFSRMNFVTATVNEMIHMLRYPSRHTKALHSRQKGNITRDIYGDKEGKKQFQILDASKIGDVKQVYKLLEGDVDIDVKCPVTGNTALMFAAEKGDQAITELLLMEQAKVFLVNNRGLSALTLAHEKGHAVIVNMICKRLEETKELDAQMLLASEKGDLATVLALLSFDTNLCFVTDRIHKKSSLHLAAEKGHFKVARFLCEMISLKPREIMKKIKYGMNYIHSTCLGGSLDLLRLLLPLFGKMNHNAITETDVNGRTALWFAARKGHLEIVRELLPIFFRINPQSIIARKTDGSNALMAAAFFGHTETVRELLPVFRKINPSSLYETYHDCDEAGKNLISIAEAKDHMETKQVIEDFIKSNNLLHPNDLVDINQNQVQSGMKTYEYSITTCV